MFILETWNCGEHVAGYMSMKSKIVTMSNSP